MFDLYSLRCKPNLDSTEKRPKTGFLHMNHSGNFSRTIEKPGFFSEPNLRGACTQTLDSPVSLDPPCDKAGKASVR